MSLQDENLTRLHSMLLGRGLGISGVGCEEKDRLAGQVNGAFKQNTHGRLPMLLLLPTKGALPK